MCEEGRDALPSNKLGSLSFLLFVSTLFFNAIITGNADDNKVIASDKAAKDNEDSHASSIQEKPGEVNKTVGESPSSSQSRNARSARKYSSKFRGVTRHRGTGRLVSVHFGLYCSLVFQGQSVGISHDEEMIKRRDRGEKADPYA